MHHNTQMKIKNLLGGNLTTVVNFFAFGAIVVIVAILPLIGWQYYDKGSDQSFTAVFKGVFSDAHGHLSNNDGNWIMLHYILQFMYVLSPRWDWYGITMIVFVSLVIYAFAKVVWFATNSSKLTVSRLFLLVVYLIPATLLVDSIVILEFTRVSILLSSLGLISIIIGTIYNVEQKHIAVYKFGLLIFCLGCLVRIQGGLLAFFLLLPFVAYMYIKSNVSFRYLMKISIFPVVFMSIATLFSSLKWNEDTDVVPKYAGYAISLKEMNTPMAQLNITNERDSITYKVITQLYYLNDPKNIDTSFFERIKAPYIDKKLYSIPAMLSNSVNFKNKLIEQGRSNIKDLSWFVVGFFLYFIICMILLPSARAKTWSWILFYLLYVIVLYAAISGLLKMERRVASPLFFSSILALLLIIQPSINSAVSNRVLKVSVFLAVVVTSCLGLISSKHYFNGVKNEAMYYTQIAHYASCKEERYIFLESLSYHVYNHPFQCDPLLSDKFYPLINSLFFADPTYGKKMKAITKSDDVEGYWKFVASNSKDCLFVSTPDEIATILQYTNTMYGLNLHFKAISKDLRLELSQDNLAALNPYYLYKIESRLGS